MPRRPRPANRAYPKSKGIESTPKSHVAEKPQATKRSFEQIDADSESSDEDEGHNSEFEQGSSRDNSPIPDEGSDNGSDDDENADAPRVVQWEDDEEEFLDDDSGDETDEEKNIHEDLQDIPLGALRKAQQVLSRAQPDSDDSESESDSDDEPEEITGKGKAKEKVEWSTAPRKDIAKRSNKHAPTEVTSKRPVSRKRIVVDVPKVVPRDPRFLPTAGEFSSDKFHQNFAFLAENHKKELATLKETLKHARKLLANSPRDQRTEREHEVYRLEQAVKRAESMVNKDRLDRVSREALRHAKKTEAEKQQQGKGQWFMKKKDKQELLVKARYDALAKEGGQRAVKKAIEKKQKKEGQKEKRSRPFAKEGNSSLLLLPSQRLLTMSFHADSEQTTQDIYRGDPPQQAPINDDIVSISTNSSSSSSSSSASSALGGRFGGIAAKLELAITRWARNVRGIDSSSSDSSSTTSSSRSSVVTLTKSQMARRRNRRPSISSLRTLQSERDIAAHITRMKALEQSRKIPRQFALYIPPSIATASKPLHAPSNTFDKPQTDSPDRRVTWSTSLPLILAQLDLAMKKAGRRRRVRHRDRISTSQPPIARSISSSPGKSLVFQGPSKARSTSLSRRGRKGKDKESLTGHRHIKPSTIQEEPQPKAQAWFLDVANPTWADLRAIGKVRSMITQDPREKLELFTKLGYYFISFRAIESSETREKLRREGGLLDEAGNPIAVDEFSTGEANVYLVVFKEGICCFHYTDVSEHTDRVRNRMVLLEEVVNMSSDRVIDWICHNILDSIVDSFFPYLERIEKEVVGIDNLVYSDDPEVLETTNLSNNILPLPNVNSTHHSDKEKIYGPHYSLAKVIAGSREKEKYSEAQRIRDSFRPRFVSPRLTLPLVLRRLKRRVGAVWKHLRKKPEQAPSARQQVLRRMAKVRKLVTVLGRLLATKSDVITQIQKRLITTGRSRTDHNPENFELAIYMGDVQDHILTLQHALSHYERMLSQSHPTYLSQLRTTFAGSKSGTDKNLLYLTVVSIAVLCLQPLTGLFSLNINVPHNVREPGGPLNVFGIVIALAIVIFCAYVYLVRSWWLQAKKRRTRL
ncbi:hypothetical protein CVT24_000534 [Panaeolus cyanescens]|uniref:Uncharacterized protein n=1 Tax=Panaeolus cyanescens TaxID=181874 RepID=A0A409VDD7_9AGAR|nr:hypothetical protein CVT24_000534 [Panaeolus cyanescens]